ncbi:RTA1-domain-containing protein [Panus rudis PR-1116 ss-1]|nr:RTA1-domain-containing protein [Panus rudis PR-1116 ss-1]
MKLWLIHSVSLLFSISSVTAVDFSDPSYDPKTDPRNILKYIPNNALTTAGLVCYLVVAVAQTYLTIRYGAKYMLYMAVAAYIYAAGLALRYALHSNPDSLAFGITQNILTVLAPCGFIAADYVVLGRLSRWLKADAHLWIRPTRIAVFFVVSDLFTLNIQGTGAGFYTSDHPERVKMGQDIVLAGLILQLISFLFFTFIYVRLLYRVHRYEPHIWFKHSGQSFLRDWRSLAYALCFSSVGVLIRSFYRVIELAQGSQGHIATTEGYFYALDALPLFLATAVFIPFWPGQYIPASEELASLDVKGIELDATTSLPGSTSHPLLSNAA